VPPEEPSIPRRFRDRSHAGRCLSELLSAYAGRSDVVVLALPRGGVPVGLEISRALSAPLDVLVVRKLGVPGQEELAFGALAPGGARVLNDEVVRHLGPRVERLIEAVSERELAELERRERLYRGGRERVDLSDRIVILVDDGLATGASMRAAIAAVRRERPERIVVAVPTASPDTCTSIEAEVDELVSPLRPANFYAVSLWYESFRQLGDDEVREMLDSAAAEDGD
jgi:predicted phosphoribosyltransferase